MIQSSVLATALFVASTNALTLHRHYSKVTRSPSKLFYRADNDPLICQVPRRAVQHVQIESQAELNLRAGFVVRDGFDDAGPLRPIRRKAIHRIRGRKKEGRKGNRNHATEALVHIEETVHNRTWPVFNGRSEKMKRQLDDTPDRGTKRVTFKATGEATKPIFSKILVASTLTDYMTQDVKNYSLLSFLPADGNQRYSEKPKQRRWSVRRLKSKEAQRYLGGTSQINDDEIEESNLFRLAVPLLPLIGWDLTPVIDLEVIPPETTFVENLNLIGTDCMVGEESEDYEGDFERRWEPLRNLRERTSRIRGGEADASSQVVKIRSLSVSLLSTQAEVKRAMSSNHSAPNRQGKKMQREAIGMVSKVEEWLRPHITFEAELSWIDGADTLVSCDDSSMELELPRSTVTVKSTACTSLTVPKIPSVMSAVPSSFLVKRLGATLTSKALAICLPRFLRQLEKDYRRWSGLDTVEM